LHYFVLILKLWAFCKANHSILELLGFFCFDYKTLWVSTCCYRRGCTVTQCCDAAHILLWRGYGTQM